MTWTAAPPVLLQLVIGAGFIIVPNPVWAMLFYLTMLPLAGIRLFRGDWRPTDAGSLAGVALIGWFTLSIFWDSSGGGHLLWLWNGLCTLVFFVFALECERERLVTIICVCALINAAVAIALFGLGHGDPTRMAGWAETRHPILGASIIGMAVVLAVGRFLGGGDTRLPAATIVVGLVFIVLTGSRGPLLAILVTLAVLLAALRPAALAGVAVIVAVPLVWPGIISRALERGWSNRLEIWQISFRKIAAHPIFGTGPATLLDRPGEDFPHNLFLSTWLYSGIIGLALLLILIALAVRAAWSEPNRVLRWTWLALLLHLVLSGLTDLSQITKGPGPMWYIVWLPIALVLSSHRSLTRHKGSLG